MSAPQLASTISLQTTRDEIVFSIARANADPNAKGSSSLAPLVQLKADWVGVDSTQFSLWDAQTEAQALISAADDGLDALVDEFAIALTAVVKKNTSDPHYILYFKTPPNVLKKPILGAELATIQGWLPKLATETDATIVPFAQLFTAAVAVADKAVAAETAADAANEQFRATGWAFQYMAEIATARDNLFLELDQRRADLGLPRGYPDQFFRHRRPTPPSDAAKAAKAAKVAAKKAQAATVAQAKAAVAAAKKALQAAAKKK